MQETAAVVVTYNRLEMLKHCIDHLKHQDIPCDILIIDNASTDGTQAWLEKQQGIRYFNTGANLGGAGGFNYGMRKAVEAGYAYIWIMDDDCFPKTDALSALYKADRLLKGRFGWLSSVALWTDGHECKMNRQKLKKSFYEYSEYMKYGVVQAEQATFVSLFLCAETIKKEGLPIRDFFIWGDDIEYTRRISVRKHYPCFVVGASQVIHAMTLNNGSSIATDAVERIARYRYAFRNENYLYRKEGLKGIVYYMAKCGLNFVRILINAPDHRGYRMRILWSSMVKGCLFNPKVEYIKE